MAGAETWRRIPNAIERLQAKRRREDQLSSRRRSGLVPVVVPMAVVVPIGIIYRHRRGARRQREHTERNGECEMFEMHDHLSSSFAAKTNARKVGIVPIHAAAI